MKEKKPNFDGVEMLLNLQTDINQIILSKALKNLTKLDKTAQDTINNIQQAINDTMKEYLDYMLSK